MNTPKINKLSIGVLKEVKDHEYRVGLDPYSVAELVAFGHDVHVQVNAGKGSGYTNKNYGNAGANVCYDPIEVVEKSDIVVKVKEPVEKEYYLLEKMKGKTLFTFLHLADNPSLAKKLLDNNITGVSYDTIEDDDGNLPILKPMSEIAGKFAIDFFEQDIHDCRIKNVLVVGAGAVGRAAVQRAVELDVPDVVVHDTNLSVAGKIEKDFYNDQVDVFVCSRKLEKEVARADLVVGAVLVKGKKAPTVVTEQMVRGMKNGSRIIDVSIDQGGCVYGSKPTSHSNPTFEYLGKTYCCIPNMPGMRPKEATKALTDVTMGHLIEMAKRGPFQYLAQKPGLLKGINTHAGKICNADVAKDLKMTSYLVIL